MLRFGWGARSGEGENCGGWAGLERIVGLRRE